MRALRGITKKVGMSPGTLVYIGASRMEKTRISILEYDKDHLIERHFANVDELMNHEISLAMAWINVCGIHAVDVIAALGMHFGIHPLIQEDIVNTNQRPKFEEHQEYVYIVLKMLFYAGETHGVEMQQVSFILGQNYMITFQETDSGIFSAVESRIRSAQGKIRAMGTDYLAYSLIDAIVDNYYSVLEYLGDKIEELEDNVVFRPHSGIVKEIHMLKNEMLFIRKSVWPLREVINAVQRGDSTIFKDETELYIRDVYDHTVQVIDTIEMYRDMVSGLLDIYLSSISNRLNEVMKVLTIISTIFIPLNFIAGVYGMNFKYMPELELEWGYPAILTLMATVAMVMLYFFRRRNWI